MASVQERLQVNRRPLDTWSTREQLCLASAVSCSGDQNWMSVSRTLKLVCGNATNRPGDWYSQKSCAVQYGHLLENVDTPKRKGRSSESNSDVASPATAETPTDLILLRLTEDRVQELKADIRSEQEEYTKIYEELKAMEGGQMTEEQLFDMWRDIEQQQETQRIEEMKLENQMREREQRRQEMQRSWRSTIGGSVATSATTIQQKVNTDTTAVDMDVEEILGSGKPLMSNVNSVAYSPQQQTATSPLLSSLLKSPTSSAAPMGGNNQASPAAGSGSARAVAPTITTLLTSGSIPNPNQPAITLKSSIMPANEAAQLLARPISGPPTDSSTATAVAQNLLSPSQSAPTLSMLLEKNKTQSGQIFASTNAKEPVSLQNADVNHAIDSNKEEVPMDIEEDVTMAAVGSNADLGDVDSDEPDPNEEQQLLEVFKNIGNIDELDIDVAAVIDDGGVDFLKGVDEESRNDASEGMDFDTKLDNEDMEHVVALSEVAKNDLKKLEVPGKAEKTDLKLADGGKTIKDAEKAANDGLKVETISSDDSNDNIPLAAVASLESKERGQNTELNAHEKNFLKEKVESAIKNEDINASEVSTETVTALAAEVETVVAEQSERAERKATPVKSVEKTSTQDETKFASVQHKSSVESENSQDVIVIPTDDDESNEEKELLQQQPESAHETEMASDKTAGHMESTKGAMADTSKAESKAQSHVDQLLWEQSTAKAQNTLAAESETNACPPPIISIDTDDSSTTDVSVSTRKDDKAGGRPSSHQCKNIFDAARNEQKSDEDSSVSMSGTTAVALSRPPLLRKLRERDRSESPMIDDEATTTSDHSTNQHSRRRYSSTPLLDSIPNSPASSDRDERETRVSKKSLLSIYNALQPNKHAITFQRVFGDEHLSKYREVCLRPMDWQTIKKNVECGAIRSVSELQRDILLMSHNALMIFKTNSADYKATLGFLQDSQGIREFTGNAHVGEPATKTDKESKDCRSSAASTAPTTGSSSSVAKLRMGSRKSQRIS